MVIADTALEIIPSEIFKHNSLKKIRKSGKNSGDILLDRTFHHFAILSSNLIDSHKRGRPDILHIALLSALATPLYRKNHLKVFVHTIDNNAIIIGDNLRLPKSYSRFEGLILDLLNNKKIVSKNGDLLLEFIEKLSFHDLVSKYVRSDITVGFSTTGVFKPVENIVHELLLYNNPCIVIGGFPKGYFSKEIDRFLDQKYSIYSEGLESHIVISRMLYEFEKISKLL